MNFVEHEIRKKYRYSNLSYVFDVYMECEYRANLTKEEYDGLLPGEFRFDYDSWGRRLGFTKKQMERAIKELTVKNAFIVQIVRGNKGTSSKYFLTRFTDNSEENNKENNEEHNKRIINVENTSFKGNTGEQKEQYKEKKKAHSSQYNNLNIISNNIYSDIFEFWISKNIKKHRSLTNEMKRSIDKALKDYSKDEILEAINNYGDMYNDSNYQWCNYQWGLNEFLVRKDKDGVRQLGLFLNEGSKYINYLKLIDMKNKKTEQNSNGQAIEIEELLGGRV